MTVFSLGRSIGIAFGTFAVVALVASFDMARGRNPETQSALVLDVLSGGEAKQCKRDVSAVVARHVKPGMTAAEAKAQVDAIIISPPRPWFWTPKPTQADNQDATRISALRTLRTTVFGNEMLRLEITLADGKVNNVDARVECAFN